MNVRQIDNINKKSFMDLLLLADEQIDMIERYLYRGEMFALYDGNDVRAICVVTDEQNGNIELKNIATCPKYQRKGYGQQLIAYLLNYYKGKASTLYVGTGDSPMTLNFYNKCGFVKSHIVKNFFVDNYDHPMYENGKQLVDMIYLKKDL